MRVRFQTRVFVYILLLVLVICLALAILFADTETKLLEQDLVAHGIHTSEILASNLRLGLLTGGEEFLDEPVEGTMEQHDTLQVAVYGEKGNLVLEREKTVLNNLKPPDKVITELKKKGNPVVLSGPRRFEFWAPVTYSRSLSRYENGFFPIPSGNRTTIGFVKLSISKDRIVNGKRYVLTWTLLLIVVSIFLGSAVAYYIASRVTIPIKSLMAEIHAIEDEGIRRISPSGDHEIRELAEAFNSMADSLEKREAARREAERTLHTSEERFRTVINNAPIILYAVDKDGVFIISEGKGLDAAVKPGGTAKGSAFGLYCTLPVEDGGGITLNRGILKRVLSGETVDFVSTVSERSFDNRLVPFRDSQGNITGAIGLAFDITERKRAEEKLRSYQEVLRSLASELSLTEERERRAIATDLHDHIGQLLAISKIKLGELKMISEDREVIRQAATIRGLVEEAIEYTRSLILELSSPILYELGLEPAVEWLTEQFREKHGLAVTFEGDGLAKPVDTETGILVFKAIRELLINIVKHAHARQAKVAISGRDGVMRVVVEDNGTGFVHTQPEAGEKGRIKSFGLFSIKESLRNAGGRMHVSSARGQGTRITLEVPLKGGGGVDTIM